MLKSIVRHLKEIAHFVNQKGLSLVFVLANKISFAVKMMRKAGEFDASLDLHGHEVSLLCAS